MSTERKLKLGHAGLNKTIYKIDKHATGKCSCSKSEKILYILFEGEKHEAERRELVSKLKSTKSQLNIDSK